MPDQKTVIRRFRKGDSKQCSALFEANLDRHYHYMGNPEKNALRSVNTPEAFEEISKRKHDRIFVVEKNDKIFGYVHFGKEGKMLRIKSSS